MYAAAGSYRPDAAVDRIIRPLLAKIRSSLPGGLDGVLRWWM